MRDKLLLISFMIFVSRICIFSQGITTGIPVFYRISTAFNFKQSIYSITFDDGTPNQFSIGVPLLTRMKIPGTFYIITKDLKKNKFCDDVISASRNCHEIGSHTVFHPRFNEVDIGRSTFEISDSKDKINSLLNTNQCLTMSYPFGIFNDSVVDVVKNFYLGARTLEAGYNDISQNFNQYLLKSINYYSGININYYNGCINTAIKSKVWMITCFHGIEGDGFQPISLKDFTKHLEFLKKQETKIWIATVSDAIKYTNERRAAKVFCEDCDNNTYYKIRIDDGLNDSIYNQPLSISVKVPENWESISISGAEYCYVEDNFIYFNALPNNKEVLIKPGIINVSKKVNTMNVIVGPNPFNEYINTYLLINQPSNIRIMIKNIFGNILLSKDLFAETSEALEFNTDNIAQGTYIFELINLETQETITKKLIKKWF